MSREITVGHAALHTMTLTLLRRSGPLARSGGEGDTNAGEATEDVEAFASLQPAAGSIARCCLHTTAPIRPG